MGTINVLTLCPSRVTRDDGAVLADAIRAAWAAGDKPTVDFGDAIIASIGFLDEGIACLAKAGINPHDHLTVVNMSKSDRDLLDHFIRKRLGF